MIIPFNLAYKEIQGLHKKTKTSLRYFVEVINFPNKGSLTYVSKSHFKPASRNKGISQKNYLPSKPKDQVRASLETLSKENNLCTKQLFKSFEGNTIRSAKLPESLQGKSSKALCAIPAMRPLLKLPS